MSIQELLNNPKIIEALLSPEVAASTIESLSSIVVAVVPSAVVYVISKRFLGNKRYIRQAVYAMREVQVLRAVIEELSDNNNAQIRQARKAVFVNRGLKTENRFTPAKLEQKITSYETMLDETPPVIEHL